MATAPSITSGEHHPSTDRIAKITIAGTLCILSMTLGFTMLPHPTGAFYALAIVNIVIFGEIWAILRFSTPEQNTRKVRRASFMAHIALWSGISTVLATICAIIAR